MLVDDDAALLRSLPLFVGIDEAAGRAFADTVESVAFEPGDALMHEGEPAGRFGLVLDGTARVVRGSEARPIGNAGPGSVVGELSLLRGRPRNATVIATTPMLVAMGDEAAFVTLLDIVPVRERLIKQASQHLAGDVEPIPYKTRDGLEIVLRPVLPGDAEALREAAEAASAETRRQRFFSSAPMSSSLIRYLTDIDYRNHFAWAAIRERVDDGGRIEAGSVRFVRYGARPNVAEVALGILDDYQRRGLGSTLLGAIGIAGEVAGVELFEAEILADNDAAIGLFTAIGARRVGGDHNTVRMEATPGVFAASAPPEIVERLRSVAGDVLELAGLALS